MVRLYCMLVTFPLLLTDHVVGTPPQTPGDDNSKNQVMVQTAVKTDKAVLSELNARFIRNFIAMDTVAHNEIIHPDFVCINSDGSVSERDEYMVAWASGFMTSGYSTFSITDEEIRVFGNMALVRSKTVYTKKFNGEIVYGNSIYTDTYIKESGRWWCVQAQLTPVRAK